MGGGGGAGQMNDKRKERGRPKTPTSPSNKRLGIVGKEKYSEQLSDRDWQPLFMTSNLRAGGKKEREGDKKKGEGEYLTLLIKSFP